jgi:DNA-binding NtrC family response regulator
LLPGSRRTAIADLLYPVEEAPDVSKCATVLVVEDEDILRKTTVAFLRRSGFEVLEACNGSAAIDALCVSGSKIDVILLDLTVPGPSSRDVAAEYAKVRPDAKVILTSAYGEDLARATVPQLHGFIRKPFHLTDLVKILRSTLSS